MAFFQISSMVLGLLDQLQIFSVVFDRIARAFDKVWHAGLLHKLEPLGIFGQIFGLSSFLNNRQPRVVLDGNGSLEYLDNAGVPIPFFYFSDSSLCRR